ncbi:MAG: YdcF family protein [Clostridium sp.]|nr:YdcF family protein [Clostridium sp.]
MKIVFIIIGIITFIIFIEPIFEDVFNAATLLGVFAGAFTVTAGILLDNTGVSQTVFCVIIFGGYGLLLICMTAVYLAGRTKAGDERVIIVLGCKVKGDLPSLSLVKRVASAYDFLQKNTKAVAILSGGQGADEYISEAQCMQAMLIDMGISSDRLIIEDRSTSTEENIRFSLEIINSLGLDSRTAIATSEYHQLRAKMICRRYGLKTSAQSAKTKAIILPTFLLREVMALAKEIIVK